jgi:hypothetical protein
MKMRPEDCRSLLQLLGITEKEELNCEEFLSLVPSYLERLKSLDASETADARKFLHHLELCVECSEEFEALQAALDELL